MTTTDDTEFRELAAELIAEAGREVTFVRLLNTVSDPNKPWRGSGTVAGADPDVSFTVMMAQLPDMTLGLIGGSGFGRMDHFEGLFPDSEIVVLVADPGPTVDPDEKFLLCNLMVDTDGTRWKVRDRKVLQPGAGRIAYAMGLVR